MWLKKWSFLGIFLVCGAVVMTATHSWADAARPAREAGEWLARVVSGESGGPRDEEDLLAEKGENPGEVPSGNGEGDAPGGSDLTDESSGESNLSDGPSGEEDDSGEQSEEVDFQGPEQEGDSQESEAPPEVTYRNPEDVVYATVEDDYFSDAVFIGDSRTVGLYEYGGLLDVATFYASKGLTIFNLLTAEIVETGDERGKITVEEALSERQFAKIYLMVGINEMGTGDLERFLTKYQEVVTRLQELQPDAILYLQAIIKVTTDRSNKGDYINNEGIVARNEGIANMADNVKSYYLDVNPLICDEDGGMIKDYTSDGVHLKAKYIPIWKDFLKEHAVVLDE